MKEIEELYKKVLVLDNPNIKFKNRRIKRILEKFVFLENEINNNFVDKDKVINNIIYYISNIERGLEGVLYEELKINVEIDILTKMEEKLEKLSEGEIGIKEGFDYLENIVLKKYKDVMEEIKIEDYEKKFEIEDNKKKYVYFGNNFKLKEMRYYYVDENVFFEKKENDKWIKVGCNQIEYKNFLKEVKNNIVKIMLKNRPAIAKKINEVNCLYDSKIRIINKLNEYWNLFKTKNINILNLIEKEKSSEKIEDFLDKVIKNNNVEKFALLIASNKYKYLLEEDNAENRYEYTKLNKKNYLIWEYLYENVTKKEIQKYIGKKIAKYKNKKDFEYDLIKFLNIKSDFNIKKIKEKIRENNLNINIELDKNNLLILKIKDFNASKILGSSSWCISTYESDFNSYTRGNNEQYFLFDFNKRSDDIKSMIGFTVNDGDVINAHYKNDYIVESSIEKNEFIKLIKKEKNKKIKKPT